MGDGGMEGKTGLYPAITHPPTLTFTYPPDNAWKM